MLEVTPTVLDKLCNDFEEMAYRAGAWWPTVKEIEEKLAPCIKEKMPFAIWIVETANPPQTNEEVEARKLLMRLIYENTVDEAEEEISEAENKEEEQKNPC